MKFRTPEQAEFAELVERVGAHHLKPTHIAARIDLTRSAVSRYMNAKGQPGPRALRDLRKLVEELDGAKARGQPITPREDWRKRVLKLIDAIEPGGSATQDATERVLAVMAEGVSSRAAGTVEALRSEALAKLVEQRSESERRPVADAPSESTGPQSPTAPVGKGARRAGRGKGQG